MNKLIWILAMLCSLGEADAQEVVSTGLSNETRIIEVPLSYKMDKQFTDLGPVKAGRVRRRQKDMEFRSHFKQQLEKVAAETVKKGGNVFQITRIEDQKQKGHYRFWAEAYRTDEFATFIQQIIKDKKKKSAQDDAYACVTLYRPAYSKGFNDNVQYEVVINDTLKLTMQSNTKYILKIAKEGNVKISVQQKNFVQNLNVPVKAGSNYYVRNYVNIPGAHKYISSGDINIRLRGYTPYLEKINDLMQGEIESSMVTQAVVTKKI